MFENLTKSKIFAYLVAIFCVLMIVSNILATKTLNIDFIALPCSILTFPLIFIVNDILSEIYGYDITKKVIYFGFVLNVIAILLYSVAIMLPSKSPNAEAFSTLLSTTPRLFIAGLCSYLIGNLLNSLILVKLKEKYNDMLFVRCVVSTIVGETVDSIIFISLSFIGVFSIHMIISMICCQVVFKVLYEIIIYPVTRKVIFNMRKLDDGEFKGQI